MLFRSVLIPTELASSIEVALKTYGGMFEAGELFHTSRGGDLTLPTNNDTEAGLRHLEERKQQYLNTQHHEEDHPDSTQGVAVDTPHSDPTDSQVAREGAAKVHPASRARLTQQLKLKNQ